MSYIIKYLKGGWKECSAEERKTIDSILWLGILAVISAILMIVAYIIDLPTAVTMAGTCTLGLLILMLNKAYSYRLSKIEELLEKKKPKKRSKKNGR